MDTEQNLMKAIGIPISIQQMPINGHTINYCVAGKGPPLLLIHGANFGWGVWYPNISELSKRFTVYGIDLPGAGRSSRIDYKKMDPQRDLADIVSKFIENLNLYNLQIIGCSIGGWLALKMALLYPTRIKALIIESGVGFADYMGLKEKVLGFYPLAQLIAKTILNPKLGSKNIERFLRSIFYNQQLNLKKEFVDYFFETMKTSHNLLFISQLTALSKYFLLENQLPHIQCPVLIVWGSEDTIIPLRKNYKNFRLLENVSVEIIREVGHIPSLEKPYEFNALVLSFLKID